MLIVYINNGLKCLKRKANNYATFLLTHALVMQGNIYKVKFTKQLQHIWPWSMLASLVRVLCWNTGSAWPWQCLLECLQPLGCDLDFHLRAFNAKASLFSSTYPKEIWDIGIVSCPQDISMPQVTHFCKDSVAQAGYRYCSYRRLITPADGACKEGKLNHREEQDLDHARPTSRRLPSHRQVGSMLHLNNDEQKALWDKHRMQKQ